MNRQQLEALLRSIRMKVRCPVCDAAYQEEDLNVISQLNSLCFFQLHCSECHTPLLGTIMLQEQAGKGILTLIDQQGNARDEEVISDLTTPDLKQIKSNKRILADDVISTHLALEKPGLTVSQLLGE